LERCVYSVTSEGRDIFVAVGSDGQVLASVRVPNVPDEPDDTNSFDLNPLLQAHERFHRAIGKMWIVLEVEDPCDHPMWFYPDVRMA